MSASPYWQHPAAQLGDDVLSYICPQYEGDGHYREAQDHIMRTLKDAGCDTLSTVFYRSGEPGTRGMLVGTARLQDSGSG